MEFKLSSQRLSMSGLPNDVTNHILSFMSIYNLMQMASLNKEFAWVKREWAAKQLQRLYRAYLPAFQARNANPAVAFFCLAQHAKRRVMAQYERTTNVCHAANPLQYVHFSLHVPGVWGSFDAGALVVSRLGWMQFIKDEVDGEWILDSTEAISSFLENHPRALDRLKHVAEYPWGQEYDQLFDDVLAIHAIHPGKLFDDGTIKPTLPRVMILR